MDEPLMEAEEAGECSAADVNAVEQEQGQRMAEELETFIIRPLERKLCRCTQMYAVTPLKAIVYCEALGCILHGETGKIFEPLSARQHDKLLQLVLDPMNAMRRIVRVTASRSPDPNRHLQFIDVDTEPRARGLRQTGRGGGRVGRPLAHLHSVAQPR